MFGKLALVALALIAAAFAVSGQAEARHPGGSLGRYIIVLDQGADPAAVAADHGLAPAHVYRAALNGFAAPVSPAALAALRGDPRVRLVERDSVQHILGEALPTGIDRIEADKNPNANGVTVDLDIAIIDTGIDADHPDLNVAGGYNFAPGPSSKWDDGNGHGTHVAGIAAAKDNDIGVRGVAPGARVWAIRVCNNGGRCATSDIVAGIDAVAACKQKALGQDTTCQLKAEGINFAAANMSISTNDDKNPCGIGSDSVHLAICGLVNSGVVFALAAGNSDRAKDAYPEVLAVSALADFDGRAGGQGSPTCRSDEDDTLANFSNYGPEVDIAAPGVCILSTWKDGGYNTISGTSMAAPHVAGAVALYLHANGLAPATDAAGVDAIEQAILDAALPEGTSNHPCGYTNEHAGEGSTEPLLFVNAAAFGGDGSCDVAGQLAHDVAVTAVSTVSEAFQGDSIGVDVSLANQGTSDETFDVTLTDSTDGVAIGTQSVTLAAGATATVSFSYDLSTTASLGDHTLTAEVVLASDEDPADNTGSATLTVKDDHNVAVTAVSAPSSVVQGDTAAVDVSVANTGKFDETFDVVLEDATDGVTIGSQSVTLAAGGSTTVSFAWDTSTASLGDHTLTATAGPVAGEEDTADNSRSVVVTVSETVAGDANDMYVWDIVPSTSRSGPWANVMVTVTIRRDSDASGSAEETDEPVSDARVEMRLERDSACDGAYESGWNFAGKTRSDGSVTFTLKTSKPEGCYRATVMDVDGDGQAVTHSTYTHNPSLDRNNPRLFQLDSGGSLVAALPGRRTPAPL